MLAMNQQGEIGIPQITTPTGDGVNESNIETSGVEGMAEYSITYFEAVRICDL